MILFVAFKKDIRIRPYTRFLLFIFPIMLLWRIIHHWLLNGWFSKTVVLIISRANIIFVLISYLCLSFKYICETHVDLFEYLYHNCAIWKYGLAYFRVYLSKHFYYFLKSLSNVDITITTAAPYLLQEGVLFKFWFSQERSKFTLRYKQNY